MFYFDKLVCFEGCYNDGIVRCYYDVIVRCYKMFFVSYYYIVFIYLDVIMKKSIFNDMWY